MNKNLRIIFMGTPEFAVPSLDILIKNGYTIVGVVTVPDKPAGRGLQPQQSAIKKYAIEKGLKVLQPEKLKEEHFFQQLQDLKADLQIVVAFRMLPEIVWNMPPLGTFNLHASLLPQYRGAAPINWAVINGKKETGVTTFFLQHEIDTGKIIFRKETAIGEDETAGEVHDRLMNIGSELVLQTVKAIESGNYTQTEQHTLNTENAALQLAPKIFKEDAKIDWNKTTHQIHNLVRGLNPYPAAWTEISKGDKIFSMKIFKTLKENSLHNYDTGTLITDSKNFLKVAVNDGFIHILELQLAGKKRLLIKEFLRGFPIDNTFICFVVPS